MRLLDAAYVPADVPASSGGQVLWAAGERWPSEIWRYVPGTSEPERIFASPRHKATISSIVASSAGYAFVEQSEPAFGDGGWRVWFLAAVGAEPVELARGVARLAGVSPQLAMDDERVAWAAFDEPPTGFVTRLQVAPISDLAHVTTVVERPVAQSLIWYPSLDRDDLWFSTIHPNADPGAEGPEYNVEVLDLGSPASQPVPFGGSGTHDFDPAVNDAYVVWKSNRPGDAALNWGALKVLDRGSQQLWTIPVENANRPTIGDRFVGFDEIQHASVYLYDPHTRTLLDLASGSAEWRTGSVVVGGESVSGRLLTFSFGPTDASAPPRIGWAILPE